MFLICAIKDKKAEAFGQVIQFKNKAVATREFSILVNDEKSQINKFNKDYALYCIGVYDENTGQITATQKPELIVEAESLIQK